MHFAWFGNRLRFGLSRAAQAGLPTLRPAKVRMARAPVPSCGRAFREMVALEQFAGKTETGAVPLRAVCGASESSALNSQRAFAAGWCS